MTSHASNRPFNRLDTDLRPIYDSVDDLAFQGIYSGSNLTFKGQARPGSLTSEPVWQICQLTYTGSNLVSITWPLNANGAPSNDYEFVFDDYASYTYQ
jgi:hypothetical protein